MTKPFFTYDDADMMTEVSVNGVPYQRGISLIKANLLFNEWLAKGRVVECHIMGDGSGYWGKHCATPTHSALLINIEPIEQDSERQVLADFVRDPGHAVGSLTYVPPSESFQTILTQILEELKTINTSLDVLVERGNS